MYLGPIHPLLPNLATGHNPIKNTKITSNLGHEQVLFDSTYPVTLAGGVPEQDFTTVVWESSQVAAIARLMQIKELHQNTEWQRCGLYIQWREDAINDAEDGWYVIRDTDIHEDLLIASYAAPQINVELRDRFGVSIATYADAKVLPNDANLGGVAMAALPSGFTTPYPVQLVAIAGANGTIPLFENPTSVIRAKLITPIDTMNKSRCFVRDQTTNRSTVTEVFWKDHRNVNGKWEIANDLLRYYFAEGDNAPAIDIWDTTAAAWITVGNYQLQTSNAGPILPLQSVQFQTISPEEVIWIERRYDAAGTSMVTVTNRIRRGSRIIESMIVAASGAGLTGTQSVGFVSLVNVAHTVVQSADTTGVVFTSTDKSLPGFCYLNAYTSVPTSPTNLTAYSGLQVPAGTIARIGLLLGDQDAHYTLLGATGAAYAAKYSSYNRMRVKQRILVGTTVA